MEKYKYKKGDKLYLMEMENARVFPVIVEEAITNPDHITGKTINQGYGRYRGYERLYRVALEVTPAVHDQLCFNGIVKPLPFEISKDDLFTEDMLSNNAMKAHQELKDKLSSEHDELKKRLDAIKWYKKGLTETLNKLAKLAGLKYKVGDTAWFISRDYPDDNVVRGTLISFDRGDYIHKPYLFKDAKWGNEHWVEADDVFDTKEAAVERLKQEMLAQLEERCQEA